MRFWPHKCELVPPAKRRKLTRAHKLATGGDNTLTSELTQLGTHWQRISHRHQRMRPLIYGYYLWLRVCQKDRRRLAQAGQRGRRMNELRGVHPCLGPPVFGGRLFAHFLHSLLLEDCQTQCKHKHRTNLGPCLAGAPSLARLPTPPPVGRPSAGAWLGVGWAIVFWTHWWRLFVRLAWFGWRTKANTHTHWLAG